MKCLACSHENLVDAKFCEECGEPLARVCPSCGKPVAPNAKFCRDCGFRLAAPASPPPTPTPVEIPLSRPTPTRLASEPVSPTLDGERKLVTLLFTDIVGSTALAEKLDPEEWGEIVAGAHQRVSDEVYRRDGTIAQLLGDGALAFFGAPRTHEDDAVRAVSAALEILESIQEYARELAARRGLDVFRMRVGLNTGLVVVGNVGGERHTEYLAVGDSVNLAARMQSAAEPNTVLISSGTARLVRHAFELESRGPFDLKGKSEPVPAFRVVARKSVPDSARGIEGLHSPLVGRESETRILDERVGELGRGNGQIVSLIAEAGLGKSRLVAELRASHDRGELVTGESAPMAIEWLEGRSQSYEASTPYAPFAYLFSRWAALPHEPRLGDAARYDRVAARVREVAPDRVMEIAPFLATLLGIGLSGDALDRVRYVEPPALRALIFQAVRELIQDIAAARPVVLVLEDLHWVDTASLELVEALLPLTERVPLLVLAVFRPQRQEPSWRFHETAERNHPDRYTPIVLEPLDAASSRQLVANLLHVEDLPEKLRELILTKAEGNPFFVEEMIRTLLDAKLVVREGDHWRATRDIETIAVPDTLGGVIGARLDRLAPESKRTIQTASVIGREFAVEVLTDVSDRRAEQGASLDDLRRRELIHPAPAQPDLAYLFKHAMTQETAYASVLLSRRRELHCRVAQCLERVDPSLVHDIARHFLEARESARALPYLVEAGERSAKGYATPEAIDYFTKALDVVKTVDDVGLARRAFEGLGQSYALVGQGQRALEIFNAMLQFAVDHGDIPMKVSALNKVSTVLMWGGQFGDIESGLGEAERLARESRDLPGLAELFMIRCAICTFGADFNGAVGHLAESVQIGRDLQVNDLTVFGLTHSANTFGYMARFDEMWETAQQAYALASDMGNLRFQSELLGFSIAYHYLVNGELGEALRSAMAACELARRINFSQSLAVAAYVAGSIHTLLGQYEAAIARFDEGMRAGGSLGVAFLEAPGLALLGGVYHQLGDRYAAQVEELHSHAASLLEQPIGMPAGGSAWVDLGFVTLAGGRIDSASEFFQKGLTIPTMHGQLNRPLFLIGSAMVALARGDVTGAAEATAAARRYAGDRVMTFLYPTMDLADGRVQATLGNDAVALERFADAEDRAVAMGQRPLIWQAQAAAARLLDKLGRPAESEVKLAAARAGIEEIAALFADESLRVAYRETATAKLG
jgi:class 3 adenylate cyclase/tetratricopeptide (TPR) repeat protein